VRLRFGQLNSFLEHLASEHYSEPGFFSCNKLTCKALIIPRPAPMIFKAKNYFVLTFMAHHAIEYRALCAISINLRFVPNNIGQI
jgi:hypothetical protein